MTGLEIAKNYYLEYGAPMIHEKFPEYESRLAVGLVGAGSECFGYDDEISRDHDFEPGFCIFLPDDLAADRKLVFELERAYSYLPREYAGLKRQLVRPAGGSRRGILTISGFYSDRVGDLSRLDHPFGWLALSEHALAEATNGEVFRDDAGIFSGIRGKLLAMPDDVILKKLAGRLALASQAGQYNYERSVSRGDLASAQLAAFEFVRQIVSAMFALDRRYLPYYKWVFRALSASTRFAKHCDSLEFLISTQNDGDLPSIKLQVIGDICADVAAELKSRDLSSADTSDLGAHAASVNSRIGDPAMRSLDLLAAAESAF